ncbi:D-isomer specific 2-hydroxyacid dehydrogenase family protein [Williamsia muralis]|uniref:D-isomer specific 2-hydroxyacid dehydrogenase family protein n=1 Tax=Williamsia marianensis TaxID=85044 RepID=A0ABU4ER32_WILMA|nr:D-isomer specific 2-hydroxyacid dehydrogenase family protein [Williamsia muralis]MDV7133712.1 D-isomer specific 2-hydroxyacid dehydrogenase family protein [Williamsia muralis]
MPYSKSVEQAVRRPTPVGSTTKAAPSVGITVYGCEHDEARLFEEMALELGVAVIVTAATVSTSNAALAAGNRCISIGHKAPVSNPTLEALSRAGVEYISTRSIGRNHLDVEYARRLGISVGNVSYSPDSVADYAVMLMLMSVRDAKSVIRRTDVSDYRLSEVRGRELRDMTVGVVGTGRIGTAVMNRLRGFGSRILAYDTRPTVGIDYVDLDELVQQSDILTLHTPLDAGTHHLLDRERICRMKRGAYIVNTGRGSLIDTEALVSALERGDLGGAALDVVEGEEGIFYADCRTRPLGRTLLSRLQRMPNVIVSPHTAYYTDHALRDTVENSIVNCLRFERDHRG